METTGRAARRVTVGSLLGLAEVRAGAPEVLTAGADLDVPVRWVHVADTEGIGALIEGGELVLSTAAGFRSSTARVRRFLQDLAGAGAAGVLIELVDEDGRPDSAAVARLRRAAEGTTLPVIVLRRRIKFVRVTQAAHRLLIGEQLDQVDRFRHVHELFTRLNLDSADEQTILEAAARLVGGPVVLEDVAHRVLLAAGGEPAEDDDQSLTGWGDRAGMPGHAPVGPGSQVWGRLVAPRMEATDVAGIYVLERAGQALALARMAARDEEDLLRRARAGFLQALMAEDLDEDQAQARASDLGLRHAEVYVPVVAHLAADPEEDVTQVQLHERAAVDAWLGAGRSLGVDLLTTSVRNGSVALLLGLAAEEGAVDATLSRMTALVEERTGVAEPRRARGSTPGIWTVGVGPAGSTLVRGAAGLGEADQVARAAAVTQTRRLPFYRFADVRLRGLVALLADDPRVRTFGEAELGPLLDGRPPWGLDLLALYLAHGGNKSEVARAAHLSRQALYARLRRLEEVLGVSLDDPESRTALHLAVLWSRLRPRP
ncbi:MAG: PucR family transcriptional regulator [Acidobacteria bacterium]|nr:MAG: PucR family transcriptional regulator [Acidobacteriota bacterium]